MRAFVTVLFRGAASALGSSGLIALLLASLVFPVGVFRPIHLGVGERCGLALVTSSLSLCRFPAIEFGRDGEEETHEAQELFS